MKNDRAIAVVGATGNQGGAVARTLIETGEWRVRGLTRDPGKPEASALAQLGVELVQADLDDRASLDRAFQGAYGVFSVQNFWTVGYEAEIRQGKAVADAALDAGVSHLLYSSVGSADQSTGLLHFESKWQIEQYIAGLDMSATIVRPVFWMDNFSGPSFKPSLREGKLIVALPPETKLQMIALQDIGVFAAIVFGAPSQFVGTAIDIAGDALTMPEVAATFTRVMGCPIEYVQQNIAEVHAANAEWAKMLEWFERVGYRADIPHLRQLHPGLLTFEQWVRQSEWAPVGARAGTPPRCW